MKIKKIDLARQLIELGISEEARAALEREFPELKESDDERIRKEIINYLNFAERHNLLRSADCEKREGWIAYLEKQKEQKPAEWSEEEKARIDRIVDVLDLAEEKGMITYSDWGEYVMYVRSLRPHIGLTPVQKTAISRAMSLAKEKGEESLANELNGILESANDMQYHWKPSEEQMCELNWASKLSPVLESLYNDLKKL